MSKTQRRKKTFYVTGLLRCRKLDFTKPGEKVFFHTAYQELCGEDMRVNAVFIWCIRDEAGQPHLHFCFIPVGVLIKERD